MASHKLTFGFDLMFMRHMVVTNLSTKFGGNMSIQSGDTEIFQNSIYGQRHCMIFTLSVRACSMSDEV